MNYINDLMKNHPLSTETELSDNDNLKKVIGETETEYDENFIEQIAGGNENLEPYGGFPPIYICKNIKSDDDIYMLIKKNKKTQRGYETQKSSVNIKDIIEKRKNTKPFIKF